MTLHSATMVPVYALYGEEQPVETPGFAHIETIAARSSLHDWEIGTHRHRSFAQVLIVQQGEVDVRLGDERLRLAAPAFVAVRAGIVHGFHFRPQTHGVIVTLAADYEGVARAPALAAMLDHGGYGAMAPDEAVRVERVARELLDLIDDWREPDALFHALVLALLHAVQRAARVGAGYDIDPRMAQFHELVERHYRDSRDLAFYAGELGVTTRTLTRLTAGRTGLGPMELVNRRRVAEARRLLRYSNASVAQVAEALGFVDVSYFSRFYARLTGRRPSHDRHHTAFEQAVTEDEYNNQ